MNYLLENYSQADAELRLYCAFSFPAVVITIGPDRWGELRDSFGVLLRDPSWSVRKTLSHSLHEVGLRYKTVQCYCHSPVAGVKLQ